MRRFPLFLIGALLVSMTGAFPATAQEIGPFDDLGLPELEITITADAYEGIPETLEAGRYLVTVTAAEDTADLGFGRVSFVQPTGFTAEEFLAFVAGPPPAASPVPDAAAEGGDEFTVPPEIYDFVFAGGAGTPTGQSTQVVLDLPPGEWVAFAEDDEVGTQAPVVFEATGEMPADMPEPGSSATLTMGEYLIEVTEGEIVSGPQVLHLTNVGAQPHFVFATSTTKPITNDDVMAILMAEATGTPPAVDINPETDFTDLFSSATQSMGTNMWITADIPAGSLVLLCFFPDSSDGLPHAFHGMHNVVEVTE